MIKRKRKPSAWFVLKGLPASIAAIYKDAFERLQDRTPEARQARALKKEISEWNRKVDEKKGRRF